MYVPSHFATDPAAAEAVLAAHPFVDLVSAGPDGLVITPLPMLYGAGRLRGHVARPNDHWRLPDGTATVAIVRGPDAYISPGWYASRAEHGRVVPTWDYRTIHVHGRLVVHDDLGWVRALVGELTAVYEAGRARPWSIEDAPADYVARQLRAIVGIELVIERIEAKDKLSQNRPPADIDGVLAGLAEGDPAAQAMAAAIDAARPDR